MNLGGHVARIVTKILSQTLFEYLKYETSCETKT